MVSADAFACRVLACQVHRPISNVHYIVTHCTPVCVRHWGGRCSLKPTDKSDKLHQQAAKRVRRFLLASFKTNAQRAALLSASAPHAGIPLTCIPLDDRPSHYMPTPLFSQYVRMNWHMLQASPTLPLAHDHLQPPRYTDAEYRHVFG